CGRDHTSTAPRFCQRSHAKQRSSPKAPRPQAPAIGSFPLPFTCADSQTCLGTGAVPELQF
uniref:Uncharacterized protein n=1 Tax=Apteryx owenii TaxID=8824 RepID=A0A8B9S4R1_APTOW